MTSGPAIPGLVIRSAEPGDVAALLAIERASFSSLPWTPEDFINRTCHVAELNGEIVGFLVSHEVFRGDASTRPDREILNLAVAPCYRRRQVASALLSHELRTKAVFFLEVRESNLAAQALYRRFGFVPIGSRENYYSHPVESALVMQMK